MKKVVKKVTRLNGVPFQIYLSHEVMKKLKNLKEKTYVPMATQVRIWVEEKVKEER